MEEKFRNKYGRPAKGRLKRSHKLTVAFNDDEYEVMKIKADKVGLRPAEWCRRCSVQQKIKEALTPNDRVLLKGFWNVGNNLNQLVREMHSKYGFHEAWINVIKDLIKEMKEIKSYYREVIRNDR